jgi:hypothetical protein
MKQPLIRDDRVVPLLSLIIFVWSVLGVELTLVWNSVSDVYRVDSTGQLIPIAIGLGGFIPIIYRFGKNWKVSIHSE